LALLYNNSVPNGIGFHENSPQNIHICRLSGSDIFFRLIPRDGKPPLLAFHFDFIPGLSLSFGKLKSLSLK